MEPELEQFIKDNKIEITDDELTEYCEDIRRDNDGMSFENATYKYINYKICRLNQDIVKENYSHFLCTRNDAMSVCRELNYIMGCLQAIQIDDVQYLNKLATQKTMTPTYLGYVYYSLGILKQARHYLKLGILTGFSASLLFDIEFGLLREFNVKLNDDDLLLAYELKTKHNKPGLKELQQKIEKEYFDRLELPKVLSNLVVSYLLYKK